MVRVSPDVTLDPTFSGKESPSVAETDIEAINGVCAKLLGEMTVSLVVLGHHQEARSVLVDSMNNSGSLYTVDAAEVIDVKEEGIH
jgi:hypothetical protein